ncbi:MAG TPA: phosphatidate cytidylyltransferase, partial [Terriglobales bacterium]|nr:phosphatidate cytidylyltransferase [Terriglobales bacterium]
WAWMAFVAAISILGLLEYATMAFADRPGERLLTAIFGALVTLAGCFYPAEILVGVLAIVTIAGLTWVLFGRRDFEAGLRDLGLMLAGILYLGLLTPYFVRLHGVPEVGRHLVLFVIAVGMAGDTGGYFVGHRLGRHKLMPRVSPGKTVEGSIGIMLGSLAGAALAKVLWLPSYDWNTIVMLALVMGVLGQIGDLSESVMKRTFGTKESGSLFPGHGGVLDRIDSLLFPAVFLYYHSALAVRF